MENVEYNQLWSAASLATIRFFISTRSSLVSMGKVLENEWNDCLSFHWPSNSAKVDARSFFQNSFQNSRIESRVSIVRILSKSFRQCKKQLAVKIHASTQEVLVPKIGLVKVHFSLKRSSSSEYLFMAIDRAYLLPNNSPLITYIKVFELFQQQLSEQPNGHSDRAYLVKIHKKPSFFENKHKYIQTNIHPLSSSMQQPPNVFFQECGSVQEHRSSLANTHFKKINYESQQTSYTVTI